MLLMPTYRIRVARRSEKNMAVKHQETYVHVHLCGSRCILVVIIITGILCCGFIAHVNCFNLSQDKFLGWSRSVP